MMMNWGHLEYSFAVCLFKVSDLNKYRECLKNRNYCNKWKIKFHFHYDSNWSNKRTECTWPYISHKDRCLGTIKPQKDKYRNNKSSDNIYNWSCPKYNSKDQKYNKHHKGNTSKKSVYSVCKVEGVCRANKNCSKKKREIIWPSNKLKEKILIL